MDQDTALELVKKGATLLLLGVPQHTLVGIGTQIYSVGPRFKGIKMIPPGLHFVYCSSCNRDDNQFSPALGFFVITSSSEVVVRQWHPQEEKLVKVSEEEDERYCNAVKHLEFDDQLGPYALDKFGEWKQISNYITKDTIARIEPIGGEISIAYESGLDESMPKTILEKNLDEQLKDSNIFGSSERPKKPRCYYTPIPNFVKRKDISREQLTALNLDKTELLENILMKNFGGNEDLLLGELQFAFVAFLMGQSLEAFYQWKALVSLLFSCTLAPLHTRSQLFLKFIRVIYYQLKHGCRTDKAATDKGISLFLDDSLLTKDSFLRRLCKEFFNLVQEAEVIDGDLLSWTRKLRGLLESRLGWDFQEGMDVTYEDDEFSPVVVP